MDLKFSNNENPGDGVRRIAGALNVMAIEHIKILSKKDTHEAVHELRKRFKEIRALLRLVRDDLGEDVFKKENIFYRDLGREIDEIRDAKAYLEMIDLLKEKYEKKIYKNAFLHIEKQLQSNITSIEEKINLKSTLSSMKERLEKKAKEINDLPLKAEKFEDVMESLYRVYKRGYKALQKIEKEPTPENFHEWRKRAKYLRYQFEMLHPIWPGMMNFLENEYHKVSDITGHHHDLSNILNFLSDSQVEPKEYDLFKALANDLRLELEAKAISIGEKLYAEKPEQFINRMESYFLAHENTYTIGQNIPQKSSQ